MFSRLYKKRNKREENNLNANRLIRLAGAVLAGGAATLLGIDPQVSCRADEFTVGRSGADVAFNTLQLTGNGVTVAVIDSGIIYHPDLNVAKGFSSRVL